VTYLSPTLSETRRIASPDTNDSTPILSKETLANTRTNSLPSSAVKADGSHEESNTHVEVPPLNKMVSCFSV
jgi:hypothetical protein